MRVEHQIEIDAPPELVWNVTEDVERWPEWSPAMQSVRRTDEGLFDVGSGARIKQTALAEAEWTVTELVRGERFSWETRMPGLRMVGSHEVAPQGAGTRSRLAIAVSGPLGVLLWPLMILPMHWALAKENRGLKHWCEMRSTERE